MLGVFASLAPRISVEFKSLVLHQIMWIQLECETDIQILPIGEETFHTWDNGCECCPRFALGDNGKMIVTHNAFDQRQVLEIAYHTPLHRVRQEVDC